ncbi:flagellar protein FlaG [Brevibacillus centrosporus]|uniref:flagellar protein FlaG n=1 Tax=Brevibacillus centrosporus TaxID=54910 RepID=UPI003D1FB5BF
MDLNSVNNLGKVIQLAPELTMGNGNGRQDVEEGFSGTVLEERKISREQMENQVDALNKFTQASSSHLKFTLHEKLNEYYVQIVDDQTNEIIREVPSKKILDFTAKFREMIGILIDEKR